MKLQLKFLFHFLATIVTAHISSEALNGSLIHPQKICKFFKNYGQSDGYLYVSAVHHEPFMYQNAHGQFYKGIEFEFLTIIAQKLQKKLLFREWIGSEYDQLLE